MALGGCSTWRRRPGSRTPRCCSATPRTVGPPGYRTGCGSPRGATTDHCPCRRGDPVTARGVARPSRGQGACRRGRAGSEKQARREDGSDRHEHHGRRRGSEQAPELDDRQHRLRRTLESLTGIAFTEGNQLTVLRNGDRIFPAMLRRHRGGRAQRRPDDVRLLEGRHRARASPNALSAAARRGVRVRLLIDAVGGLQIEKGLVDRMDEAGVHVEWFRKPWLNSPLKQNHRCHRKVLVVDEEIGFTGGVGIAEEWCGDARDEREWRDTHVEVRGPAVDGLMRGLRAELGGERPRPLRRRRPLPAAAAGRRDRRPGGARLGLDRLGRPADDLPGACWTPRRSGCGWPRAYFAPDEFFLDRLCAAAQRGVEVDVLLPGPHADKRVCQLASEAAYDQLVCCGVRVWNFQPSMMHAKIMTRGRPGRRGRLVQLQPPLPRPRRGGAARRAGHRGGLGAGGALRRRPASAASRST